jgi:hypothetical protein
LGGSTRSVRSKRWPRLGRTCGAIERVIILERTCEASQSVVIWEGTCGASDPNGGFVWGELVERSKEWSFWREHVERSNRWSRLDRTCGAIQRVVNLERTCEASQSVVIWEGTCGASDPNGGLVWGELVERSKEWSFWREHAERSNRWSVVTIGVNVWSDPKCGHLRED